MTNQVFKTEAQAKRELRTRIDAKRTELKEAQEIPEYTEEEVEAAVARMKEMLNTENVAEGVAKITEREWALIHINQLQDEISKMVETLYLDLITPAGNYVMTNEQLVSPSGFHPDEKVFIKPRRGVMLPKLPLSSNLRYYDFTGAGA